MKLYKWAKNNTWLDDDGKKDIEDEEEEYITSSEAKFLKEWQEIVRAAQTSVALKKALDRVKITYNLSKDHSN